MHRAARGDKEWFAKKNNTNTCGHSSVAQYRHIQLHTHYTIFFRILVWLLLPSSLIMIEVLMINWLQYIIRLPNKRGNGLIWKNKENEKEQI